MFTVVVRKQKYVNAEFQSVIRCTFNEARCQGSLGKLLPWSSQSIGPEFKSPIIAALSCRIGRKFCFDSAVGIRHRENSTLYPFKKNVTGAAYFQSKLRTDPAV